MGLGLEDLPSRLLISHVEIWIQGLKRFRRVHPGVEQGRHVLAVRPVRTVAGSLDGADVESHLHLVRGTPTALHLSPEEVALCDKYFGDLMDELNYR